MHNFISIAVFLSTFVLMELVAWSAHKYLMHGFLWNLHEDHHTKRPCFFEKNDAFFLIFATPSFFTILAGMAWNVPYVHFSGFGIAAYGCAYFLVHDVLIHQRFKWFRNVKNPYLLALRRAHKIHHKHLGKHDGECFGMLWVPMKYYREAFRIADSLNKS